MNNRVRYAVVVERVSVGADVSKRFKSTPFSLNKQKITYARNFVVFNYKKKKLKNFLVKLFVQKIKINNN